MYRISVDTGYNLSLKRVHTVDGLANEGRKLVIVALVGTNLHIRIFDANRKRIVDKAENELMSGETLTTLKKQLNPLSDESRLSQEQKQKIIRNATSIAGHNLNSYYLRIFWFILRIFWFIFLFLVCGIILYGLEDKDRFIGLVFTVYLLGIFAILYNFRVIRHKEVHIVFALAFKYQERLFSSKGSDVATQSGNEKQQSG